ncbi:hypothetical protein AArcSl_2764 [Halalkaliarchaeum desulfuricum]|uniref:Uncharacterized protein n=1 Tax=Halalkaliarchaeum desulfuricum TaxID=2055893 RepID=A0A343TMQ7_9EURY|nr:hypothetical protein [Halalkaliarchaeum desulfuricum]AUX10379.1 hypothetical protein AArcSl_2764 [Halalkaliarchaeum desulfuricum]
MSLSNSFDGLRQPEYTGENRCLPCTVVNLGIATALGIGVTGVLVSSGTTIELSSVVGGAIIAVSAGLIYLRGYLVPGTPTLTKRYMPLWMLRLFGKAPEPVRDDRGNVEVESFLLEAGVIEECPDDDDLCLTESFETAWRDRIDAMRDGANGEAIDPGIDDFVDRGEVEEDVDLGDVVFEERGSAYVATLDGRRIAKWESRPAYLADAAAAAELRRRAAGWRVLGFPERTEVAGSLRLWLEECPDCEGPVTMDQETVQSCCHERQVLAATCDNCGVRLFEANISPGALDSN